MAPEQVHGNIATALGECATHAFAEFLDRNRILVEQELHRRLAEHVIHHAVELVAFQPANRVVPDLAHNVGIRIHRLHAAAEFLPKAIVVNFIRNIEAPAVNAALHPILAYREKVFAHIGAVRIEFRERRKVPPAFVIGLVGIGVQRPALHMEPVHIRRMLAQFHEAIELKESTGAMVEHAIQNHAQL